jgi:rare lipoprotein A
LRRFAIFCAAVLLLFAVFGVAAIKAARADVATWYGFEAETAFVARGDPQACTDYPQATCTCASSQFPIGAQLKITYGSRSVVCRVTDRGPFDWTPAVLVLSFGAARVLGIVESGHADVSIRRMGRLE